MTVRDLPWLVGALAIAWGPVAAPAAADPYAVGNQVTVGSSAGGMLVIDRASGTAEITDATSLRVDALYTHGFNRQGNAFQAIASGTWEHDDHWSFGAVLGFAPPSGTAASLPVHVTAADGSTLATGVDLKSRAWSGNGELSAEYDTGGEGAASTTYGVALGARVIGSTQKIIGVTADNGTTTSIDQLRMTCATRGCPPEIQGLLEKSQTTLGQLQLTGGATETLWRTTDLDLYATYFAYTEDPLKSGFFSASTAGRSEAASLGLPVAPLRFSVAPALTHRFGRVVSVTASAQYGRCVDAHCTTVLTGAKARFQIGDSWRLTLAVMLQRDAITGSPIAWSRATAVGAMYSF